LSVILGINAFHPGSSAALLIDGAPIAAIAEERLNRVKYYAGFPRLAIQRCLEMAGASLADVDAVAVARDPSANRLQKALYVVKHPGNVLNLLRIRAARSDLADNKALFARELECAPTGLRFQQHNVEHHVAHIASAFFAAPWEQAAGISIDGSGDFVSCMLANCQGDVIAVKQRVFVPESLGFLYTMICQFIGYPKYGDEGKVMGLAPLGTDAFADVFEEIVTLTPAGFRLSSKYFLPFGSNDGMRIDDSGEVELQRFYSKVMVDRLGGPRVPDAEIGQRDKDLAWGLQNAFERAYLHLLNLLHKSAPHERVALAGGCALNSVANGKVFTETPFQETWIQPAAGDDGLALGAALYVARTAFKAQPWEMRDAYLGPEYTDTEIETELRRSGVSYARHAREALLAETVESLVRGQVVGWFQGRMEWGPRALGNRSILTHPGYPGMKDTLNARIKRREWFRPFAPVVLAERQCEIFDNSHPSPFMLHVYNIRPDWRERLSAVTHVDGTGRLQTVKRAENPIYYDLIAAFARRTGIPVLLNTSFNENEPIVNTPAEAIDCYRRTKMDCLVIGPFIARKEPRA
jgi:carbamoyltransferase